MTKKNNANSARRKLIPAVGMLVVSAMMLSSSTYAWFTMSDSVSVTGMQMKATSEGGLLIINETDTDTPANWKTEATASHSGAGAVFFPTSTATTNTSEWYYNSSDTFNDAKAGQAADTYVHISPNDGDPADGIYGITTATANNAGTVTAPVGNYYLLNNFYVKSSGAALTNGTLDITQVKAAIDETSPNQAHGDKAAALNKSLRVAIKVGANDAIIFAPFAGADDTVTYTVGGSTGGTSVTAKKVTVSTGAVAAADSPSGQTNVPSNAATVAAGDEQAVNVKVYAYFEGEDANCMSANTVNGLDQLKLEMKLKWTPTNS